MDDKKKESVQKKDGKEFKDVLFLTNIGDVCGQINKIQDIIMQGIYQEYIKDNKSDKDNDNDNDKDSISYREFVDTILDARRT